jgi:hypothetical protein
MRGTKKNSGTYGAKAHEEKGYVSGALRGGILQTAKAHAFQKGTIGQSRRPSKETLHDGRDAAQ